MIHSGLMYMMMMVIRSVLEMLARGSSRSLATGSRQCGWFQVTSRWPVRFRRATLLLLLLLLHCWCLRWVSFLFEFLAESLTNGIFELEIRTYKNDIRKKRKLKSGSGLTCDLFRFSSFNTRWSALTLWQTDTWGSRGKVSELKISWNQKFGKIKKKILKGWTFYSLCWWFIWPFPWVWECAEDTALPTSELVADDPSLRKLE